MINNELNSFSKQPYNTPSNLPIDSDPEKKKINTKSLILIVIEIFLLIFVAVLVITFLKQRNNNVQPVSEVNSELDDAASVSYQNEVTNVNETPVNSKPVMSSNSKDNNTKNITSAKTEDDLRLSAPIPDQSMVVPESAVPSQAVKISGTTKGFEPNQFTASPGQEIILALTSRIDSPVVLTFYSPKMPATSLGCGAGETRYLTFKAPLEKGEYIFKNDIIGHSSEAGKMIVK